MDAMQWTRTLQAPQNFADCLVGEVITDGQYEELKNRIDNIDHNHLRPGNLKQRHASTR
jgi:hypothetical protein